MGKCKKCGWLIACDDCSKEYAKIDEELDELEQKEKVRE